VDEESPGWDAIDAALAALYPNVTPIHVAPGPDVAFGSGVQGISAYPAARHWHYVTYGLSELWEKESEDLATSGFGYEFTIRVPSAEADAQPPQWPFVLLEKLAQTVRSGSGYWIGHRADVGGPIDGGASRLNGLAFVRDPELGEIDTPNGSLMFIQIVGVTHDELSEMRASSTERVTSRLALDNPLLITREE
jgi:Suppressor of fused protein (SUFU)